MVFSKGRYSLPILSCSLFSPISRRGGARLPRRNDWGLSYPVGSRQLRESLSLDAYVRLGTSLIVGVFSLLSPTLLTSSVYKGQQGLSRFDVLVLTLVTAAWVFWDHSRICTRNENLISPIQFPLDRTTLARAAISTRVCR